MNASFSSVPSFSAVDIMNEAVFWPGGMVTEPKVAPVKSACVACVPVMLYIKIISVLTFSADETVYVIESPSVTVEVPAVRMNDSEAFPLPHKEFSRHFCVVPCLFFLGNGQQEQGYLLFCPLMEVSQL